MRFSKQFKTFNAWLKAKSRDTTYSNRIIRLHKIFPNVTLSQLVKGSVVLSKTSWKVLSPKLKAERNLALETLRLMRDGNSLTYASREIGLSSLKIKRHLGNVLVKDRARWFARSSDRIQRSMIIYEKGIGKVGIVVTNSKDASLIGKYFATVKEALPTGDDSKLKKFKKITIIDADGKKHKLETNLERLFEIEEEAEDIEIFEIYSDE